MPELSPAAAVRRHIAQACAALIAAYGMLERTPPAPESEYGRLSAWAGALEKQSAELRQAIEELHKAHPWRGV